jgi:hypothetical protein
VTFRERLLTGTAIVGVILLAAFIAGVAVWIQHNVAEKPPVAGPDGQVRRAPRPAVGECKPKFLTSTAWTAAPSKADAPDAVAILLGNNGPSQCTLSGTPALMGNLPDGRRVRVPSEPAALPIDPVAQFPGTIDGGEPARVVITPSHDCGTVTPVRYTGLALLVGGREFPVVGMDAIPACNVEIGTWHVIPPLLTDIK